MLRTITKLVQISTNERYHSISFKNVQNSQHVKIEVWNSLDGRWFVSCWPWYSIAGRSRKSRGQRASQHDAQRAQGRHREGLI